MLPYAGFLSLIFYTALLSHVKPTLHTVRLTPRHTAVLGTFDAAGLDDLHTADGTI